MSKDAILSWKDADSWKPRVRGLLSDVITEDVVVRFLQRPPEFVVADDLSWLDKIVKAATKRHVDSKNVLSRRLVEQYSLIRAYHACCPTDFESYRRNGILPLDVNVAHTFARQFFCETAGATVHDVEAAINAQDASLREGRIWLGLDDRMLIEDCGHYLLYGSEYLVAIAADLTRKSKSAVDYRRFLKRRGTPTIIACNVPLAAMEERTVAELAGFMLAELFVNILDSTHPNEPFDFGFELTKPLPPENIVEFTHPSPIRDPLGLD